MAGNLRIFAGIVDLWAELMAAMCSVAVTVGLSHVLEEMMQLFNSKGPGIPDQVVMDRGPADG